jgi:hypothetical protein
VDSRQDASNFSPVLRKIVNHGGTSAIRILKASVFLCQLSSTERSNR